ncbi:bZIP transcription factor 60 [Argentina anserina]|uniref:bZIP transcription factor 60 n=1 Tax=Argentina anserina TaxID=57926 RepID=UPI0021766463|nr:bZIP transcription factor 60 [Potentilla anserina]
MEFDGSLDFLDTGVDVIGDIDWDFVFDDANGLGLLSPTLTPAGDGASPSSSSSSTVENSPAIAATGSMDTWIGEVEDMLMKDDDVSKVASEEPPKEYYENFLADVLVDSPPPVAESPADVDSNSNGSAESEKEKTDGSPLNNDTDADADDHVSKKRRRQLRNKDAAMRSRERRKMYVTDLEMKSKYLEGECRRLGRLLQCCYAENHALRLSLQMGNACGRDVSGTKQESAVLLLELLLLGSLLWFLDSMCLFTLPLMPHLLLLTLNQEQANKALEGVGPRARGEANKMVLALQSQSFVMTRRCKASRTKMKYAIFVS